MEGSKVNTCFCRQGRPSAWTGSPWGVSHYAPANVCSEEPHRNMYEGLSMGALRGRNADLVIFVKAAIPGSRNVGEGVLVLWSRGEGGVASGGGQHHEEWGTQDSGLVLDELHGFLALPDVTHL